jgi:hypothetical protein
MTDAETAWLGGLFEGEGNIAFVGKYSVCLSINMTDEDVVAKCFSVSGVGRRHGPYRVGLPRQKPMWSWIVGKQEELRHVLPLLLPWLGERRSARIVEAMARLEKVRRIGFCTRGHAMTGENLYVAPGCGQRLCRACSRIRDKARAGTEKRKEWDRKRGQSPKVKLQKKAASKRFRERRALERMTS